MPEPSILEKKACPQDKPSPESKPLGFYQSLTPHKMGNTQLQSHLDLFLCARGEGGNKTNQRNMCEDRTRGTQGHKKTETKS